MGRELVFDAWTPMSFKRVLGNKTQPGHSYEAPSWVGDHARRLMAYKVLQAYADNAAREFLATTDEQKIEAHREYGDASLIRQTILAALLGEDQEIVVEGAKEDKDDGDDDDAEVKWVLQEWLRTQWTLERGPLKLQETERDAVGLGDGVYSIGWSEAKSRARIRVWDPGCYFPVLTDGNEDDYPDKVHLAWEIPVQDRRDRNKPEIRRLTFELTDLDQPRSYAWNDKPSAVTCLYSDASFQIDPNQNVRNLTSETAIFTPGEDGEPLDEVDLLIDFIPIIHIPNTVSIKDHYGRSSIATVLQILDDLANSDTDLQAASATAARPVIALSGGSLGKKAPNYNPGEVWEVGDGAMSILDTSAALDALLKYVEFLLSRLSTNARTPDALLGRVDPSEVPSGLAVQLTFGPLAAMVGEMRLSRGEKYPLLLKFLWRINVANKAQDTPAAWFDSDLQLGSYLPQDRASVVDLVVKLLGLAGGRAAISRETGVAMLVAAGFPIEDASREIERMQTEDYTGATQLRDAVNSDALVLDYLGLEKPDDLTKPPPPIIPGNPDEPPPPGGTPPVPPPPA